MIQFSFSNFLNHRAFKMSLMPLCLFSLSSCTGLAVGTGVAVGTAAVQEGGLSRAASDARIQAEINQLWFSHNVNMFTKLDLTINQGRVLITGVVQDPAHRVEAVRLAWKPSGVVHVINEIKVANSTGIVGFAKDAWVSGRLRTALILDRQVESINYSIDTVQGTIYLMGFAQDQTELNHVTGIARTIAGVRQVVSYVKIAGTPEPQAGAPVSYGQVNGGQAAVHANAPYGQISAQPAGQATGEPIEWNQESVYE